MLSWYIFYITNPALHNIIKIHTVTQNYREIYSTHLKLPSDGCLEGNFGFRNPKDTLTCNSSTFYTYKKAHPTLEISNSFLNTGYTDVHFQTVFKS